MKNFKSNTIFFISKLLCFHFLNFGFQKSYLLHNGLCEQSTKPTKQCCKWIPFNGWCKLNHNTENECAKSPVILHPLEYVLQSYHLFFRVSHHTLKYICCKSAEYLGRSCRHISWWYPVFHAQEFLQPLELAYHDELS